MKIVEAFTAIMLIAGVLIVIAGSLRQETQNFSSAVYDSEYAMLREVQLNNSLRTEIISVSSANLPVEWSDVGFPQNTKAKITSRTPPHLECVAKLCGISDICISEDTPATKDVFVKSAFIGANSNNYAPRKLNLFCWGK